MASSNNKFNIDNDLDNIKNKFDQLNILVDQNNKTHNSSVENNKKILKAGMLLDHIAKIATYRRKIPNGYAIDLYSAPPAYVLNKCDHHIENLAKEDFNLDKPTETCSKVAGEVIKCFSEAMDEYFEETKKY